jgi:hypothetical protein
MSQVYVIPPERVQLQKHRITSGVITMFITVPLATALVVFCFSGGRQSLSAQEMVRPMVGLTIAGIALWLHTSTLGSFRIEVEGDRITQTQNRPFGMSPLKLSFLRQDIAHIREVRKTACTFTDAAATVSTSTCTSRAPSKTTMTSAPASRPGTLSRTPGYSASR